MEIMNNIMKIKGYKDSFNEIRLNANVYMQAYFMSLPDGKNRIDDKIVLDNIAYTIVNQTYYPTFNQVMVIINKANNAVTFIIRGEMDFNGNPEDLDTFLAEIGGRKL
ncbi:hypothetical protein [Stutzerimonas zhaodongensis]|uniref:hypothetical protein n=1 Tax=Stutzerimonas zhaodongensis TaxID=1176257 RepID=UPI001F4E341C|nr:hypothetical protein [Stutzerimonas zhaodongensis]UNG20214.1 hypothetical protein MKP10_08300 [Stutzerimonas zhaodongensis]